MELEVEARTGVAAGQRSPDRLTQRNGYRERTWETRPGRIERRAPGTGPRLAAPVAACHHRAKPCPGAMMRIERALEKVLFASRWLLAPFYFALVLALLTLLYKAMAEVWHLLTHVTTSRDSDVILGVLSLVDLTLTGSLLIIVIFSGYENFVSRIDEADHPDWPEWMGKIDFTGLKLKLLSSIVAISAIQVLKGFMDVKNLSDRDLMWLVIIHVVFVGSGVFLALTDRIAESGYKGSKTKHGAGGL